MKSDNYIKDILKEKLIQDVTLFHKQYPVESIIDFISDTIILNINTHEEQAQDLISNVTIGVEIMRHFSNINAYIKDIASS